MATMVHTMSGTHLWVCFPCRKAVKKPKCSRKVARGWQYLEFPCTICRRTMIHMGPAFRTPKRDDLGQWRKAEKLRRAGFTFQGSGRNSVRELLPRKEKDVEAFLVEARRTKDRRWTGERSAVLPTDPPVVRFLKMRSLAPYARRTFKKLLLGQGPDAEVKVSWLRESWVELRWRSGVGLFITRANLPGHTSVNRNPIRRFPKRLHPGDWISIGDRGGVVLEW
jgi:hypothetical protein